MRSFAEFLKKRPSGRPFVFWYGSIEPHRPYKRGSGRQAEIDLGKVRLAPYWPDTEQVRSDVANYLAARLRKRLEETRDPRLEGRQPGKGL